MGLFDTLTDLIKYVVEAIKKVLQNIAGSLKESIYGIRIQQKQTSRYDIYADILDENQNIETLKGKITPNEQMVHIPAIEKFTFQPIIWNKYGRKTVIMSKNQHDSTGLKNEINLKKNLKGELEIKTRATPATTRKILLKHDEIKDIIKGWKYDDIWATLQVKFVGGTLNPTQFDNPYSIPFSSQSTLIANSDMLGFLKKASDMTILTTLFIGVLLGIVLGGAI